MPKNSAEKIYNKICACLRQVIIVNNSSKKKWMYIDYGLAFDGKVELSFGNDNVRNAVVFDVDNSSYSSLSLPIIAKMFSVR